MSGDKGALVNQEAADPAIAPGLSDEGAGASAFGHRSPTQIALEEVIRPIAIAAMLTCIAISLSQLVSALSAAWPGEVFCALVFVVSLESIHSQRLLWRLRFTVRDSFRFRFVEWVVIVVLVRFAVYLDYGMQRLTADVAAWQADLASFFDPSFIVMSLLVMLFWWLASRLSQTMQELEASPAERMPSITDPRHYLHSTMPRHGLTDRRARLNQIVTIFFWGGAVMLLFSGLARVDVRDLIVLRHSRSSGVILNVLIYFLIGLLLISQAQYTNLKANWELQNIPILGRLGRRWLLLAISFLLLIALIAVLLPVGYSVGLMAVLSTAIQWIMYIILQIVFTILFIFATIISFFLSLLRLGVGGEEMPLRETPAPPPPPPAVAEAGSPWWQVIRSLIFWSILTAVIGYSFYRFVVDRWGLFRGLPKLGLIAWLLQLWRGLRLGTRRAMNRLRQQIRQRRASRQVQTAKGPLRYLSLRRLSPRERVRYFYLSILRRSAQQGFGRLPSMTPLEYEAILEKSVPMAVEQAHELTQAFVEARYSEHEITKERASVAQEAWRSVKRALTARRRLQRAAQPEARPVEVDGAP